MASTPLVELALALDDGSEAAETAEMKSFKCYECAGEVCNSATGLYAGAWTAVLASIVALVDVHYQEITLRGLGKCDFRLALRADDGYVLQRLVVRLHVLRPL